MTTLLTKAFERASALPQDLQNELARELLDEIEWEQRWDKTFSESQGVLDHMAERALAQHRAGKTEQLGFDEL